MCSPYYYIRAVKLLFAIFLYQCSRLECPFLIYILKKMGYTLVVMEYFSIEVTEGQTKCLKCFIPMNT